MGAFSYILILSLVFGFGDLGDSKKDHKFFKENYNEIQSGVIELDGKRYSVVKFYMFNKEVSNLHFKEYLHYRGMEDPRYRNLSEDEADFYMSYFRHAAFDDYPAIYLTKEDALDYCSWLKDMLAQRLEIDADKIEVRLPSRIEWIYAALAGNADNVYAWDGPYLRDSEGKYMANFNIAVSQEHITYDENSGEFRIVEYKQNQGDTRYAQVESYEPNAFGLYNMSGNVAEMVMENEMALGGSYISPGYDIRARSEQDFTEANPFVGFRPIVRIKE